jgi:hypothetical protein
MIKKCKAGYSFPCFFIGKPHRCPAFRGSRKEGEKFLFFFKIYFAFFSLLCYGVRDFWLPHVHPVEPVPLPESSLRKCGRSACPGKAAD